MNSTIAADYSELRSRAEAARQIYRGKYQADFEARYHGRIAAIDVESEQAFLGDSVEEALSLAHNACPNGFFHVLRVGFPGVYKMRW